MDPKIFEDLLLNLEPQSPTVEKAFQHVRLKLIKFFSWRRCDEPDALADETISRLLKSFSTEQKPLPDKPYSYVYAVATNVFREWMRGIKKHAVLVDLDESIPSPPRIDDCQRECLKRLSVKQLELLEAYYLDREPRETLAQSEGVSLNVLRLQIHRLKYKFRLCYEDCIKQNRLQVDATTFSKGLN